MIFPTALAGKTLVLCGSASPQHCALIAKPRPFAVANRPSFGADQQRLQCRGSYALRATPAISAVAAGPSTTVKIIVQVSICTLGVGSRENFQCASSNIEHITDSMWPV